MPRLLQGFSVEGRNDVRVGVDSRTRHGYKQISETWPHKCRTFTNSRPNGSVHKQKRVRIQGSCPCFNMQVLSAPHAFLIGIVSTHSALPYSLLFRTLGLFLYRNTFTGGGCIQGKRSMSHSPTIAYRNFTLYWCSELGSQYGAPLIFLVVPPAFPHLPATAQYLA